MKTATTALGPILALCAAALPAQQNLVQINEVNFTTAGSADQWIEIANFGSSAMDLTNWSIYQATTTTGMPGNYWWGFPEGTRIPAGEVIRVRWLHAIDIGNTNPRLIDTGDTVFHFLFGLRAEPLTRDSGALALVASQNNLDMNTAGVYRDWVAWGSAPGTLAREDLAVQNGRWTTGARVGEPALDRSLALDSAQLVEPTPPTAFFHDRSPTPGSANHRGDVVSPYGTNCVLGLGQAPVLSINSIPVPGNEDFAIVTTGLQPAVSVFGLFIGAPATQGLPWIDPPCRIWVDYNLPVIGLGFIPDSSTVTFKPDLSGIPGVSFALQGIVAHPGGAGFTSGASLTVSLF